MYTAHCTHKRLSIPLDSESSNQSTVQLCLFRSFAFLDLFGEMEENGGEAAAAAAAAVSSFTGILMSKASAHKMCRCVFDFCINLIINLNLFYFNLKNDGRESENFSNNVYI